MEEHIPLIVSICKRLGVEGPILDSEEFGDGCVALAKYYPRLRPGYRPSTYLYPCILGMILKGRKHRLRCSGVADDLKFTNYQAFESLGDRENYRRVPVASPTLTPREVQVLALFAEGKSRRKIAAELHTSRSYVNVAVRRALSKLESSCPN